MNVAGQAEICRISGDPLIPALDLGRHPLGNGFLAPSQFAREYFYSLRCGFSAQSKLFQLFHQPDPSAMFHDGYAFMSSTSRFMETHFQRFAETVIQSPYVTPDNPFVVELGCNDGIMLKHFASRGIRHLGVEPSANVAKLARDHGVSTVTEFFNAALARRISDTNGQADAVLAANVMCHIPNLNDVVQGMRLMLKPKGVVMFEEPYLGDVIEKGAYDQIYDEHVFLFSALSIQYLVREHKLELIDLIPQKTHGGSMRYVVSHAGAYPVKEVVEETLMKERTLGLDDPKSFDHFRARVEKSRIDLVDLLMSLKSQGKRVAGYGATSKSTTILNYCGIGPDLVEYVSDTTPTKQGKFTPGTHIPVVPHSHFLQNRPDYTVLFAWNHADEILSKEAAYSQAGGKWILHVPFVQVLG